MVDKMFLKFDVTMTTSSYRFCITLNFWHEVSRFWIISLFLLVLITSRPFFLWLSVVLEGL